MFDETSNHEIPEDNSSTEPTEMDKLGATVALTGIGHSLADFVMSSEELFRNFCDMLGITVETTDDNSVMSIADMRAALGSAHDTFQGMHMQTSQMLALAQIFGPAAAAVTITNADADDSDDSVIDPRGGYPYI